MLDTLEAKITRLMALYEYQRQRADALEGRLALSERKVEEYREQITELNLKIDNLRLLGAFSAGGDAVQAKAGINKLIRELDKCIKLLED